MLKKKLPKFKILYYKNLIPRARSNDFLVSYAGQNAIHNYDLAVHF